MSLLAAMLGASFRMKARTFSVLSVIWIGFFTEGARAEVSIPFDGSWTEQGFLRLFTNDYEQREGRLDVVSDGTVSLLWRQVGEALWPSTSASWMWQVEEGVRPTDLTRKGGDDRNLAVYFVFVDPERAEALKSRSARRILREETARALVYVWGGDHESGAVLQSPYSPRLMTKILRPAGDGQHRERVDLHRDFRVAFGAEPGALVGLAISADSDDTRGRIVATISHLLVE